MAWWKCAVCGYLYEGENPPEVCPLCGVPAEKFVQLDDNTKNPLDAKVKSPAKESTPAKDKKWKCGVCGYLHAGDLAPTVCPLCGVASEKFATVEDVIKDESPPVHETPSQKKKTVNKDPVKEGVVTWKCTVCGYVHEGENPPESCPLCGVSSDKFVRVEGAPDPSPVHVKIKEWKCGACGYVYTGGKAPDVCPLCGVPGDQFIEGSRLKKVSADQEKSTPQSKSFLVELIQKFHVHPIAVHFPNGILPLAVIFLLLALFGCGNSFDDAAYYSMIFVLLNIPLVAYSGYVEWTYRYRAAKTSLFKIKISCSIIMSLILFVLVLWRSFDPHVVLAQSFVSYVYFGLAVLMVILAGIAGHIGGSLVFSSRR